MRKPKDKDFIETEEGLIFCVVGYLHPPQSFTAYLKYVPQPNGKWTRDHTSYRRAIDHYHVDEVNQTFVWLRENHPEYLFKCPVRNITISTVPNSRVLAYYEPEKRLQELFTSKKRDRLEAQVCQLVDSLSDLTGLSSNDFGVTGSVLLKTHNIVFSDIDLTVMGLEAAHQVREFFAETQGLVRPPFQDAPAGKKERWIRERVKRFPLTKAEAKLFLGRRWNYGYFGDRYFSIHAVRTDAEIDEVYGESRYVPLGQAEGSGKVKSAAESVFLPAVYRVENVVASVDTEEEIREVVSYEGLYSDVVKDGERFRFRGLIERVDSSGGTSYRVLIGSSQLGGRDFIKPLVGQDSA